MYRYEEIDMTMHMLPVYYTTTNHKKRKKNKSQKQLEVDRRHAKFLKKMGIGSRSSAGSERRISTPNVVGSNPTEITIPSYNEDVMYVSGMTKKEGNVYSGKRKLLGVATMHKSNMVPVFSSEDAEAISKMRR